MPSTAEYDQLDSPYRASPYAGDVATSYDVPELAELQAFVGPNAAYYFRKWAARLESPEGDIGINWVAFFFPAVWMGYRRMHRNALLCVVASIVMSVLLQMLFAFVFHSATTPVSATIIVNLMFAIVCAACGNEWYLNHARRKIAEARARGFDGQRLLFELSHRGGTSTLGGLGWLFGPIVVIFGIVVLGIVLVVAGSVAH
jgi:hypothetical protein